MFRLGCWYYYSFYMPCMLHVCEEAHQINTVLTESKLTPWKEQITQSLSLRAKFLYTLVQKKLLSPIICPVWGVNLLLVSTVLQLIILGLTTRFQQCDKVSKIVPKCISFPDEQSWNINLSNKIYAWHFVGHWSFFKTQNCSSSKSGQSGTSSHILSMEIKTEEFLHLKYPGWDMFWQLISSYPCGQSQ